MKTYSADKIRNVALLGHSSSGKTTLTEALLYSTGVITRQGRVEDGNTVSDFNKEEIARKVSIGTSVIPVEWGDYKFNFLDTPGYFDFYGEMYGAKRASEGSVLVIDASSGVEVGTEKAWKNLEKYKTPRFVYLNKMNKEDIDFDKVLSDIKTALGEKIIPVSLPLMEGDKFVGYIDILDETAFKYDGLKKTEVPVPADKVDEVNEIREKLMEMVAESDEVLMEKYFSGEKFNTEEIKKGLRLSVRDSSLAPLVVGAADTAVGVDFVLEEVSKYFPSPLTADPIPAKQGDKDVELTIDENGPFAALVFKTVIDPFVGKLTLFKVISGKLTKDMEIYNPNRDKIEKLGSLFFPRGKSQEPATEIKAGDIGATSKLEYTKTGDTLTTKAASIMFDPIQYTEPTLFMAVMAKSKNDDEKIGLSLNKLTEEDPTFVVQRNKETHELLIGGQGNMQLTVITEKLKNNFNVEVELKNPKIAYRETIKGKSDVQGKHKKQSGGAGQYGDVHIRFEPCEEDFVFSEEVFGGSVPKNFFPAIEKGLQECLPHGVLAGYPVVNIKATLYDGSYHDVDSNETAFKIAASLAFKKGMEEAKPILLEPIMKYTVSIPDNYLGDVMGDMNKRRGKILGMEQQEDGTQKLIAEAPHSEMFEYAIDLRAMTQARGNFTMEFIRYDEVPTMIAEKIIAEAKNNG